MNSNLVERDHMDAIRCTFIPLMGISFQM